MAAFGKGDLGHSSLWLSRGHLTHPGSAERNVSHSKSTYEKAENTAIPVFIMFAPAFDHSFNDLFNQYVNTDPSASGDGNKDIHFTSSFDQFFSVGSFSSDCGELSPAGPKHSQQSSAQNWHKDAWTIQQDSLNDLQLHRPKPVHDTVQPSQIVSGFNTVSLEESSPEALGLLSTSPSSPPATPSCKIHSKSAPITPKSVRVRKSNDRGSLSRKQSYSPNLMRSHLQRSKMAYPENWLLRLQHLNGQLPGAADRLPLSPPPSDILVQNESMRRDSGIHLNSSTENLLRDATDFSSHYASAMFASKMQQQPAGFINQNTSTPPPVDDMFQTPSSSDSQQLHAWHADALASTFQLTSDINGHDSHWWSSPLPTRVSQPQTQNSYLVSSLGHKSPMNHPTHQQQQQHDLLQGGLMIDFGSTFGLGANADAFSSAAPLHSTTATHIPTTSHQQPTFSHHPYVPTSQPAHQQQFIAQPSRTPSVSPTNMTSPKSRAALKNSTPRRAHARKLSSNSISTPKPVKLSTPTKGSSKGSANVSFVNFTPEDSKKILTGVAPSGSSKTKARREQEAREKRRKLSEAALLAVRNAGGDVEALEAVLC
ncbi:developmental regulatory protein WetA [Talaromyces stipitatus ATCC 10500]|uniref:Developmental regulatory protein wetA n=1 Tax=Talaromyces stipitatus (strain ATCC 10500 / CBS 375.48 / QM 6759 / NRRL 1006) TaxID=441959 RepID=B8MBI1_TALSN|nr:developmental regulatory protein WetA [Talaromyces stipitatus ATCC 10500]EED17845.1 developmental regulatory protein WetA [Talaromyces stipitatus ATCC 10500]